MKKFPLHLLALPLLGLAALFSGCSASVGSYETPASVNEALLKDTESDIASEFTKKPAAQFPAYIAVARLAGDEVRNAHRYYYRHDNYGSEAVDLSDSPKHAMIVETIGKQPDVGGATAINSLLLPKGESNAMKAIRKAAAKIHADMVLVYVVNSGLVDDDYAPFLTFITLGLAPTQDISAKATISGALIDVRTGYVYGVVNANAEDKTWSIGWTSRGIAKDLRLSVEEAVFKKFAETIPTNWKSVSTRYSGGKAPAEVVVEPDTAKPASK